MLTIALVEQVDSFTFFLLFYPFEEVLSFFAENCECCCFQAPLFLANPHLHASVSISSPVNENDCVFPANGCC
jgi:hypothetical protein